MPSRTHRSASSAPIKSNGADAVSAQSFPRSRYVLFFGVAAIGCFVDLATKQLIFQWRGFPPPYGEHSEPWWLVESYVGIETAINTGALFGAGAGFGRWFAALSVLAAIGIITWLFWFRGAKDLWLTVALACVLGGILGNLYDRLGIWYEPGMPVAWQSGVRDWILFRYKTRDWTWPNFNIADSLLVCGAIMLMWHAFRDQKATESKSDEPKRA